MNPKSNDINVIELTRQLIQVDSSDPGAYESEISDYLYGLLSEIPVSRSEKAGDRSPVHFVESDKS